MNACEAKSQISSPSLSSSLAAAAAAAIPSPMESSFDNLDALFGPTAEDEEELNHEQEEVVAKEGALELHDTGQEEISSRKVYFPEISLSDALQVTCDA